MTSHSFKYLVEEWEWKVILAGAAVQFSVVNAHPPCRHRTGGDQLSTLPFYNSHSTFLRNHLGWTYPLTISDGVDNTYIEQFKHFLLYHLLHIWI